MPYPHLEIEPKWQKTWEELKAFKAYDESDKPKYYVLDMFPYPSSQGLHVGHPEGYTATDIISRYKRARGFNVLHPIGFDAFGLPAEQHAIQTGVHPAETTRKSIENFRRQLKSIGLSFDWSREVSTCDPGYYKWTQYIFTILYEKGLAYQTSVPVNWCEELKTVLANEEVIDGKSERGGHPVVRIPMKQWMLKITDYAERLIDDLSLVDWPRRTKEGQINWIGKSVGAIIDFEFENKSKGGDKISVFTTRPDTVFGVTFMVLPPEHPNLLSLCADDKKSLVKNYIKSAQAKSEIERKTNLDKTGIFTGSYVIHPFTKERVPVWVSDYVIISYGTGNVMGVPAHDERDLEFAHKFDLKVTNVIDENGIMVGSDFLNGLNYKDAIVRVIEELEKRKVGYGHTTYKLRDWLFSRQRYWGEPFPVIHYPDSIKTVPLEELPVLLPEVADYKPRGLGVSPLANNMQWLNYAEGVTRETDTMPVSAGSSWYFLRYTDPHNDKDPFCKKKAGYWMPVDLYIGGPEHTVSHLLYSRFWHKVLYDAGLVNVPEPFQKLIHQGMILGQDGEKMSKSRGNIINPDEIVKKYGADSLRMYEMFMGPLSKDKPWQERGIDGIYRFLSRAWGLCDNLSDGDLSDDISDSTKKLLHKTIKKVTLDIESINFNTAISQMMIFVNELYKTGERPRFALKILVKLLAPFAPHISEELWEKLGENSDGKNLVCFQDWPKYDESLVVESKVTIGIQVNGKLRATIETEVDSVEGEVLSKAKKIKNVQHYVDGKKIKKTIYVPGKILNIIV